MFQPLPADAKRAITESFLAAWLEKNLQYPVARYFRVGLSENSYAAMASYSGLSGGKVWEVAPLFMAAGVNPVFVRQLQQWGAAYSDVAARFQYSPNTPARSKKTRPKEERKQ